MEHREQRLINRVLAVWLGLSQGATLPRRSQIDPILFGADWSNCFLIDLDPKLQLSRLAFVGDNLRDPSWPPFDRQTLSECEQGTLLHSALSNAARVVANGVPISVSGMGTHYDEAILYRSILLPLAETDGHIDGLLGAASFRIVSVAEEVHSFHEQRPRAPVAI